MDITDKFINGYITRRHLWNLLLSLLIGLSVLYINKTYLGNREIIKEFVIVFIAAFCVSAYFEFFLRKSISADNMRLIQMLTEYGKAGIVKYYPNFKEVVMRPYFSKGVKKIDIYVTYGQTVFNLLQDSISTYCENEEAELNIYLLSPDNKFVPALGELWGSTNPSYNETGLKSKIEDVVNNLKHTFHSVNLQGKLHAKIRVSLLKRNPVFFSFYRFDDEMFYVATKIVEPKSIVPFCFFVTRTGDDDGMYNQCMKQLTMITADKSLLDTVLAYN